MGNEQLLPAYNVQFGIADEYIAVADVNQYRSDMDCFVPFSAKIAQDVPMPLNVRKQVKTGQSISIMN